MRNFQRKGKKVLYSLPMLAFLCLLVVLFASGIVGVWGRMRDASERKQLIEERVNELKESKTKLSADISNLESEWGVEKNIREKFGLVKEGEGVIVIVEDEEGAKIGTEEEENWFINFFKSIF